MRKTLEVYRSIAEEAPDAIFVTDREGRVIYQNLAARKIFGFDDEEIFEHRPLEKIHPKNADGRELPLEECKVYRAAVHGEAARDFSWVVSRKDGSTFYASCTASPLHFENERIGALFIAADITARKTVEDALYKSNQQLKLATEAAGLGLFDHNLETDELIWSDRTREHFALAPDERNLSLDTISAHVHPEDRERVQQAMAAASRPETDGRYEFECRTIGQPDGRQRWIVSRGRWLFNDAGKPVRRIGATLDITERKLAEKRLLEASQHDSLTGLPSRALLFEYCSHLIAMAKRVGAGGGAVLFIDLDRFKPINDMHGHDAGDHVLKEVARRLSVCTRKEDIVCRLGGDEFVVVLPRVDTSYGPATAARHILDLIGKPIQYGELQLTVSPSIGISLFPVHATDLDTLIRYADVAMYASKKAGKNTYTVYAPGMEEQRNDRPQLETRLKEAISSRRMTLVYQPVIDMQSGLPVGAEALVRLMDDNGDVLCPLEFLPVAESAGLIDQLGEWVANEACSQHQRWRNAGLPPFSIAINVSPVQFRHRAFAEQLAGAVARSGIDPACLHIEVPENAVMENVEAAIATLNEIKAMGIRVSLDDFGTGFSSLAYLERLPLDTIKIDRSFTRRIYDDGADRSVTEGLIALGRSLDLKVVGEGIESEQAMNYLRRHGCDQAQGFLFSHPLPPMEFEAWYRDHLRMPQHSLLLQ